MSLVESILALPRPLLLALDVDGTLAPIVENPADARVPSEVLEAVRLVSVEVTVALVTGRDDASLSRIAPLRDVYRAVEHGRVVLAPGETVPATPLEPAIQEALEQFQLLAEQRFVARGARIEVKSAARAVHVRALAGRDPTAAEAVLREAGDVAIQLGLHARHGRAVLEAESQPGDKGAALERLLELTSAASAVYAGDDLTDAPAIELATRRGIGIFVASPERPESPGPCTTTVEGPSAIADLVSALADALGR